MAANQPNNQRKHQTHTLTHKYKQQQTKNKTTHEMKGKGRGASETALTHTQIRKMVMRKSLDSKFYCR